MLLSDLCSVTNRTNNRSKDDVMVALEKAEASLDIMDEKTSFAIFVALIEDVKEHGAEEDGVEAVERVVRVLEIKQI